jgi:hypothetical protein
MAVINERQFREALRALDRAAAFHIFDPDYRLLDVGFKIKNGRLTDQLAVRAHKRYKPRNEAFEAFRAFFPERVITEEQIGFQLDIIQANYRLHQNWAGPWPSFTSIGATNRTGMHNPLLGGVSISNEWDYNYATLGGIVQDRESSAKMILSNWHVLAGSPYVPENLRIYQPGSGDGGGPRNTIARLKRHAMLDGIDAAVAELIGNRELINKQLEIGPVSGLGNPTLGMLVTKSGRASLVTKGVITGTEGITTIPYGGFTLLVRHVVHIAQVAEGRPISSGGDSGSWWLEESSYRATGLHFAGSDNPEYGLAISMPKVFEALKIKLFNP